MIRMTMGQYQSSVYAYMRQYKTRYGQACFNVLDDLDAGLANQVRGDADLDPYHLNRPLDSERANRVFTNFFTFLNLNGIK